MILDGARLNAGDTVYSLYSGDGTVLNTADRSATVQFGSMQLTISAANITHAGKKIIGIAKPLVFWPKTRQNRDVSAYLPIIEALEQMK